METKVEALSTIIRKMTQKEILLPDFQRKFVWREEERQSLLVASVLAKMPVGSILLLSSDARDYAYKMIGCAERKTNIELGIEGEILALLDGQQRITVLTNAFSNVVFDMAKMSSKLINRTSLQRRFFLRIPKYNSGDEGVQDFFNAKKQIFPWEDPEKSEPEFLSDEIVEAIKVVPFNATGNDCYNPFIVPQPPKSDLINYCTSEKEYLIPLFLLDGKNDAWIIQIIKRISENIQIDIVTEFERVDDSLKAEFVNNVLSDEILELADDRNNITEKAEFEKELKKQGDKWAADLKSYLISCLNDIQLNQIIVDNHNRARAINIYENLNKGGVPLGTFELIMAKFASVSTENYYDKLAMNMKKTRTYPLEAYSDKLRRNDDTKDFIDDASYIATMALKCIEVRDDDIVPVYLDVYLDVISLYAHVPKFNADSIRVEHIKKNKILAIPADALKDKCEAVCEALDLALFFLQMRCGIRSIKEVNYNLMIVVIAYILLNEDFKRKSITYDYLEAWYWSSIFSGYFNIDQTERAITSIKKLIEAIKFEDSSWIKNISMGVFATNYFSEKQFLLLKKDDTGIVPKDFLKDAICQFFLARTYNGIIDNRILLTPFCKLALERHHVIPLGSLKYPNEKIKKSEDNLRNEKSYFLNSPVNFIYITDEENKSISDDKLSDYQMRVNNPSTRMLLGFAGNLDTSTEECCKSVLENRFDHINGQVRQQIDTLIP